MRTEELKNFKERLSAINRNFSHGLFLSEQFLIDNSELLKSESEALSREIYIKNSYRAHFNYKLKDIPEEIKEYQKSTFISFYVFMYSAFELYIENFSIFIGEIMKNKVKKINNISELECVFIYFGKNIRTYINPEELETLDYIRLRRNCLVHANGKPSKILIRLITTKGHQLNAYWQNTRIKPNTIDFSSVQIEQFSEREIIDSIMILRELASKIDQKVLSFLGKKRIIDHVLCDFKVNFAKDIREKPRTRIESMFANIVKRRFDIEKKDISFSTLTF